MTKPIVSALDSTVNVACPLATETVVLTLAGVTTPFGSDRVEFWAVVQIDTGVGATTVTVRVRRNGLTGTIVAGSGALNVAASSHVTVQVAGEDTPGEVGGGTYVVTVTCAGVAGTTARETVLATVL